MKNSKIRKIVKETIQEEFNNETRYVVTMDLYVWGKSDEEAIANAKQIAKDLDDKMDNEAKIIRIDKQPFGTMGSTEVNFD